MTERVRWRRSGCGRRRGGRVRGRIGRAVRIQFVLQTAEERFAHNTAVGSLLATQTRTCDVHMGLWLASERSGNGLVVATAIGGALRLRERMDVL